MTIEEKAALLTGATSWTTVGVPRLAIPPVVFADGPHGVRRVPDLGSLDTKTALPATCFPTASALASSWDPALLRAVGEAIGEEAQALGVDVVLGPGVNIKRTPLCGRNFEYFAEDPLLAGELAVGYIQGVQSRGVGTSLKHFAVNNQETRRMTVDAQLDERTLREIYLPAFEAAVLRARPWTVMCAYNRVNGILASQNHYLLTDILRGEWGFDGVVVSDWGAVRDRGAALAAGLDLEMPGPRPHRVRSVIEAVRLGRIAPDAVDAAAARLVALAGRADARPDRDGFNEDGHHAIARQAAADAIVLLKNDGLLPLHDISRLAVIGRSARHPHFQGSGSSHITPTRVDEPLAEIARVAEGVDVTYAEGYPDGPGSRPDLIAEAAALAAAADAAVLFVALPSWKEVEGVDRADLDLTDQQVALIEAVAAAQPRTVVVLNNGSAVAMAEWVDVVPALLEAWMMGQAGGGAVADVLFGRANPSGKLAETFPTRLADTPAFLNYPGEQDVVRYGEGLFVGYRWYDARDLDVQFPFGHGLSYATFEYRDVRVSSPVVGPGGEVMVGVEVTNTSAVAGREVVQVYVGERAPRVMRPVKELKGFSKVLVEPGQTVTVTIPLGPRAFEHYDPARACWLADPGEYEILVGASSRDIRGQVTVTMRPRADLPTRLTRDSTLGDWLADPRGKPLAVTLLDELTPMLVRSLGSNPDNPGTLDIFGLSFLYSMPVSTVVEFAGVPDGPSGDHVTESMLERLGAVEGTTPMTGLPTVAMREVAAP